MMKLHYLQVQSHTFACLYFGSTFPKSGGAFKVQVYSPYIFINKTGLPFDLAAKTWTGGQKPVAGNDLFKSETICVSRELVADAVQMTITEKRLQLSVRQHHHHGCLAHRDGY